MPRFRIVSRVIAFLLMAALWLPSQTITLENIAARGRLHDNLYTNDLLGVEVQLPPSTFAKLNTGTSEVRAILLDEANKVDDVNQQYNFSILVRLPTTEAPNAEQLVGMLKKNFEAQGYETLQSGVPVNLEGLAFLRLDVVTKAGSAPFYKSVVVTLRNGYLFGFWVGGPSQSALERILDLKGKVRFTTPALP